MRTARLKDTLLHTEMFLEHQYSTGWAEEERDTRPLGISTSTSISVRLQSAKRFGVKGKALDFK